MDEIDLLALDPVSGDRYHIESSVSISSGFSKLTDQPFSVVNLKDRVKAPAQRRTLGYFVERKFGAAQVLSKLKHYGFVSGNYKRIIVTWGWTESAARTAESQDIQLWDFRDLVSEIARSSVRHDIYFTDDTMRTLQLFAKAHARKS